MVKWNMQKMYNYCKEYNLDLPKDNQTYTKAQDKYIYICPKHGEYYRSWSKHKDRKICGKCKIINKNKKEFIRKCKEGNKDLPMSEYKDSHTKVKFMCKICNSVYFQTPDVHLRCSGSGCSSCGNDIISRKLSFDNEYYVKLCVNNNIDIPIEKYKNMNTRIKHKCSICGNEYKISPYEHLRGYGCPLHKYSKGENLILNFLNKNNIKYIFQNKFEDLKNISYLSYDFYLPDYNILIEYQGIQHYKPTSFGDKGTKKVYNKFLIQKEHDRLKKEYAKNNGYNLLCIPYTYDNQEKINKFLELYINNDK